MISEHNHTDEISRTCPKVIKSILKKCAAEHIPKRNKYKPKENPTKDIEEILTNRIQAWKDEDSNKAKEPTKQLRAQVRIDRRARIKKMVSRVELFTKRRH